MIKSLDALIGRTRPVAPSALVSQMKVVQDCEIVFHLTAVDMETPLHVMMWAPALQASGVKWYVIAREIHHAEALRAAGIAVVHVGDEAQLRMAMAPKVKAVLYANNSHKNIELLKRFPDLVHVQMLHGDSDKPSSFRKVTKNFDQIWVAGRLGQDRYAMNGITLPERAFIHVARPQVRERTIGPRVAQWRDAPVIAYMPTWYGFQDDMKLSSLDRADQIIRAIRGVSPTAQIICKLHPMSYKDPNWAQLESRLKTALGETGGRMVPKEDDATSVYEQADVLVTDISSTMSDYLWSNRPMAVIAPRGFDAQMQAGFPSLGGAHLVDEALDGLAAALTDCLTLDAMAQARAQMRAYSFGGLAPDEPADAAFIRAVQALVAR